MDPPPVIRAVFLDRDDTLLDDEGYMNDPARVRLLPGVADALRRLHRRGLRLVLVSNQSGVARGLITRPQVEQIQRRMCELLAGVQFAAFEYCFHHPDEGCPCRKPAPAMILRAARRLGLDPRRAVMVGDRESDVEAGNAAGCWTVLLAHRDRAESTAADHVAPDLGAAADWILALQRPRT